jgi:hypothetical protein
MAPARRALNKSTSAQAHACSGSPTHTHTQTNIQYLLLFHSNNVFFNAPHCYVIRTLPVLYSLRIGIYNTIKFSVLRIRKFIY